MFKMDEKFIIGIPKIDEQHRMLFEITDNVYKLLKDTYTIDKYDKLVGLLEELKDYAAYHFKDEEEYMQSINYKKMFTQKMDHDNFIKKLNEIDLSKLDDNQNGYILSILDFLTKWLSEHILEKDSLIGK